MVRNLVVLGLSSHPQLTEIICNHLGIPPGNILLSKFAVGETRVEVGESVREQDVFIIQSGGGNVNDHLMELLIAISACKTASAKRVTAVLPLFPYSRQSDIPYNKRGAPLARGPDNTRNGSYSFESTPQTPHPSQPESTGLKAGSDKLQRQLSNLQNGVRDFAFDPRSPVKTGNSNNDPMLESTSSLGRTATGGSGADEQGGRAILDKTPNFEPQRGYKQWVAQAGTLVADLLTSAGADHIITMDLHDPQYQGFFDIPVDNLYGRHLLRRYIQYKVPQYQQAVVVSPDAGGAKRATAIADALGMPFALIHKVSELS